MQKVDGSFDGTDLREGWGTFDRSNNRRSVLNLENEQKVLPAILYRVKIEMPDFLYWFSIN